MLVTYKKDHILSKILKSYETYFDVEECNNTEIPIVAKCEFHVYNEKYVLVKSAQLWKSEANEYIYIFKTENLTKDCFNKCKDYAYENGMKLINPAPGHMYSYITVIFICDNCDKEVTKLIKQCKIIKNFKFSIHGWMEYRISCISTNENQIFGNKSSKDTTKFLNSLLTEKTSRFNQFSILNMKK